MFEGWDSFFILVGSAASAFVGLLFVVATLTNGRGNVEVGTRFFLTPTVIHFSTVIVLSCLACAPRVSSQVDGGIIGGCGVLGLAYAALVVRNIQLARATAPIHWSDMWCYGVAPAAVYAGLAASAWEVWQGSNSGAYCIAILLVVLLVVGIRNAWDLVTWLAPRQEAR